MSNHLEILKILADVLFYSVIGGLGVSTHDLFFPKNNCLRENIGFTIVSGFIALGLTVLIPDNIYFNILLVISIFATGFLVPNFKSWMSGRKILGILIKACVSLSKPFNLDPS